MNGADLLCDSLLANGVDVCFANPGTSEMHFVAALDRRPEMRCVLGLFEGVVTGAADGYARMADKPAATLLHLGPGLTNALANVHNAKRAGTPMINVVGNHATYHQVYDAPLSSDVEALARPMSAWVGNCESAEIIGQRVNEAWQAAMATPGVATLVLPADSAWNDAGNALPIPASRPVPPAFTTATLTAIRSAVARGDRIALLIDGPALRAGPLETASRIATHLGARLLRPTSPARIERGAGRVSPDAVPYPLDQALALFAEVDTLVLIGAAAPVAFFAYPGMPGVPTRADTQILSLAEPGSDVIGALAALLVETGAADATAALVPARTPDMPPPGPLTGEAATAIVARLLPDQAIVVHEGLTQARAFPAQSAGAAQHDLLHLTGGAIGIGLPLAAGAAIACPDRRVISLQADGSAMYTVQALWTQARENLDILTVIFANRTYFTLHGEMRRVGVNDFGQNARRMMNLEEPALDWVGLARAQGVHAGRATTVEEFARQFSAMLAMRGPRLIEAVI